MTEAHAAPYPSRRKRGCDRCNHHLGTAAVCPVCGWEDLDKLEDMAVYRAERRGYDRPRVDEADPPIVIFTDRELRGLAYIKHLRVYGTYRDTPP